MKPNLNLLLFIVIVAGLINIILGIFIMHNQYLIIMGCLLTAIGAGWKHLFHGK